MGREKLKEKTKWLAFFLNRKRKKKNKGEKRAKDNLGEETKV